MEGGPRVGEGKGGRRQARVRARGPFTVRRMPYAVLEAPLVEGPLVAVGAPAGVWRRSSEGKGGRQG